MGETETNCSSMEWDVLSPKPLGRGAQKEGIAEVCRLRAGEGAAQDSVGGMQCLPTTDLAAGEAMPGPRNLTSPQSKD